MPALGLRLKRDWLHLWGLVTHHSSLKKHESSSFSTLIRTLSIESSDTAAKLKEAQSNREDSLAFYLDSVTLKGSEELTVHLQKLEKVYQRSRRLRGLSVLIRRLENDFEIGLESTLTGFHSVVLDAMRDVMEVEFLLREFTHQPSMIDQWLQATPKELYDKFRPAVLRQRDANRLGLRPQKMDEASDYTLHSETLHVSPPARPSFFERGLHNHEDPFSTDICFWEMSEHARRVLFAVHHLRRKLARHIESPLGPTRGLKRFKDAWVRTQRTQDIYVWMSNRTRKHDGSFDYGN